MAGEKEFPLALVIKAVDKATAPLRAINEKIKETTAPFRKLGNAFHALGEEAGVEKIAHKFHHVKEALGEVGKGLKETAERFLEMNGVGALVLYELIEKTVSAGAELAVMAKRVGLGVDAFAQLQFAAGQAHISQEEFNGAMDQFNRRLGEAKAGSGPLLEFLKKVSPALAQQIVKAKDTSSALDLMTKAFEKVKDPAKRAILSTEAFGKSGAQWGQFLGQGTEALHEQMKEFERLAGPQEAFAENSEELEKGMNKTKVAFLGLRNAAASQLFPALSKIVEVLTELIASKREGIVAWAKEAAAAIEKWVKGGGFERLVEGIKDVVSGVVSFVSAIGGFKAVLIGIAAFMAGPLLAALGPATAAIFQLGVTLMATPAGLFILAIAAIATSIYLIYQNWDGIKAYFKKLWSDVVYLAQEAWGGLSDFFTALWNGITDRFTKAWDFIKTIVDKMGGVVGILTDPFGAAAKGVTALLSPPEGGGRPQLNTAVAAPIQNTRNTEARVTVDFSNLPRGARVTPARGNTAPLDLNSGYSMVTP